MNANEFQLRDNTGRELAVYDMNTNRLKYFNLLGNGSLGRVEANWDSVWISDPNHESSGYWRYSRNDYRYYYIKDHLGSIRITIDETGNVVNAQDYYSFGGILRSYITGALNDERYKFTGKERDTETSYDYFGARYYDSNLGRFLIIDPHSDSYPNLSPYVYCGNNPLCYIDPTGMDSTEASTTQSILDFCETIQKGYEIIKDGAVNTGKKVIDNLKKGAQTVLDDGPGVLNNISDGVAYTGLAFSSIALMSGNGELGVPILTETYTLSTEIDVAATGLAGINYLVNDDRNGLDKALVQLERAVTGKVFGEGMGSLAKSVTKYVPIFYPGTF